MSTYRQAILPVLLLSIGFISAILFTTLTVGQDQFFILFGTVSIAFACLYGLYQLSAGSKQRVTWLIGLAIVLRLCLIWVNPGLSDDIYRFIWDGMLWHDGINPFVDTPTQLLESLNLRGEYQDLYPLLNSQDYYTIYPPVCQFIFWLSTLGWLPTWLFGAPLIKLVFLIAEIATIYFLLALVRSFDIDDRSLLLYALNPMIILEFCGNMHFEAVMICFLMMMIYFLRSGHLIVAGIGFGLAVAAKLVPLMFGPFLLFYLGWRRGLKFFIPAGIVVIGSFALMLQDHLSSMLASTNLYFQTFEFNASLYYLLRWIVGSAVGYNPIHFVGPLLSVLSLTYILMLSWSGRGYSQFKQRHIQILLIIFTLYLICATTVHPWYVSTLVILSVLGGLRFPIIWSYVIMLSYSAYIAQPVVENHLLIFIEYLAVAAFCYYEYLQGRFKPFLSLVGPLK